MNNNPNELLTVPEACANLRIGRATIYKPVAARQLVKTRNPAVRRTTL